MPPNTLIAEMVKVLSEINPSISVSDEHKRACLNLAYRIAKVKGWEQRDVLNGKMGETINIWRMILEFAKGDDWLSTRGLLI